MDDGGCEIVGGGLSWRVAMRRHHAVWPISTSRGRPPHVSFGGTTEDLWSIRALQVATRTGLFSALLTHALRSSADLVSLRSNRGQELNNGAHPGYAAHLSVHHDPELGRYHAFRRQQPNEIAVVVCHQAGQNGNAHPSSACLVMHAARARSQNHSGRAGVLFQPWSAPEAGVLLIPSNDIQIR